jgi:diguanylate cyclase (GGDEF)-like protein
MYLDLWKSTQALRDLASKDQQTGLLNNRSFVAAVEDRLRAGRSLALLVGDLDRFKSINDLHGHPTGDSVIAAVGEILRDMFDEIAVLGRMGGEEYAVMIECPFVDPEIAHAHAAALAEEMRRRVASITLESERGRVAPTISIGVAWSRPDTSFSELYGRADKALYVAKSAGRDRVVGEHEIDHLDAERTLARRQDIYWRPVPVETDENAVVAWA